MDGTRKTGGFHAPRFGEPVDLEAHVALLPATASCRGLFFLDSINRLEARARTMPDRSGAPSRRYQAFGDYAYADYLRLQHKTAKTLFPNEPVGEGLRRLGQGAYDALLASHVGRIVFGVFGKNFGLIAKMGAKGWGVSLNFGTVGLEELGTRHVRYRFRDMPAFLETLQVGVVEGAMRACGVRGEVLVRMNGLASADFDVRWSE